MSQDPQLFVGKVDDDGKVHLDFPTQFRAFCKAKLKGQCVDVWIGPQGRMQTRKQSAGYHAMLQPWAREEGHRIEDLKRDCLAHVFGTVEHTNPITGEVSVGLVEPHTSRLSRAKYSELIERTLEIAAECGVVLEAPSEFRERREKAQRQARKEQTR